MPRRNRAERVPIDEYRPSQAVRKALAKNRGSAEAIATTGEARASRLNYVAPVIGGVAYGSWAHGLIEVLSPFETARLAEFGPDTENRNPKGFKALRRFVQQHGYRVEAAYVDANAHAVPEVRGGVKVNTYSVRIPDMQDILASVLDSVNFDFRFVTTGNLSGPCGEESVPRHLSLHDGMVATALRGTVRVNSRQKPSEALLGDLLTNPDYSPDIMADMLNFPADAIRTGGDYNGMAAFDDAIAWPEHVGYTRQNGRPLTGIIYGDDFGF